jgi:hypothetical protein
MRFVPLLIALVLVGCQAQPVVDDVPSRQSFDASRADVWERLVAAVEAEGLSIDEADPSSRRLSATLVAYQDRGWAVCTPRRVIDRHDDKSRRGRGRPVHRQLDLAADVDAQSTVGLRASISERQINPFKNLPFDVRCRSTGALERSLFDRIGGS